MSYLHEFIILFFFIQIKKNSFLNLGPNWKFFNYRMRFNPIQKRNYLTKKKLEFL